MQAKIYALEWRDPTQKKRAADRLNSHSKNQPSLFVAGDADAAIDPELSVGNLVRDLYLHAYYVFMEGTPLAPHSKALT